ncbi:QueT transporter family protein [Pradoshia sp.]
MNIRTLAVNGVLAALYIAVTMLIQPFGFTNVQFRVSEMFNHLIVFNKKYFIGIVIGVFFSNLFFSSLGGYDLIFGVGQSVLALSMTILVSRFIKNMWGRMIVNTIVFTATMFLIAIELNIVLGFPFWWTYLTTAVGEFVVMAIGMPIMNALNKRIDFKNLI